MSFMHFAALTAAAASPRVFTLSGDDILLVGAFSRTWGWTFQASGGVQEYRNGFTQSGPASDWIDPKIGFVAADYEVRGGLQSESCSQPKSTTGSNAFIPTQVGAIGSWYGLSIDRNFRWGIYTDFDNEFCNGWIRYEIRNVTNPGQNILTSAVDGAPIIAVGEDASAYYYQIEIGFE